MARFSDREIERIKKEVPIERLVESYGVKLEKKGKDLVGLCKFHDDREPSLVVTPEKQLWKCFGACGDGGSVIDWVMKAESVSFPQAVDILKSKWLTDKDSGSASPNPAPATGQLFETEADKQQLLNQTIEFYHKTLKETPVALKYLAKRKLFHSEIVDRFKLGFATRKLGFQMSGGKSRSAIALKQQLKDIGILRESGHEHFNGSLVIPIMDDKQKVVGAYGRKINDDLRKGTAYHLYLPGPHKGVWNIEVLEASREIILCEALIDALTFWCYGFRNVTSSYGINGFTSNHLAAFKKYGTEKVLIAYDSDKAGDAAAESLASKLNTEGIKCLRINFPHRMDANDYACHEERPEEALKWAIDNAQPLLVTGNYDGKWSGLNDNRSGQNEKKSPPSQAQVIGLSGRSQGEKIAKNISKIDTIGHLEEKKPQNAYIGDSSIDDPSYRSGAGEKAAAKEEKTPKNSPEPKDTKPSSRIPHLESQTRDEVVIVLGERRWRIRGLGRCLSYEQLKVNVLVSVSNRFFVDTLDLYSSRLRVVFIKHAAVELELNEDIIKNDLGRVLLKLEELQDEQIKKTLEPEKPVVRMTAKEREDALAFLRDPRLMERILEDFAKCGVVGEETNKLVGYLAAVSRKLENPLAVIIQSSSAAGKTWLMDAILSFMPEEERIKYSAMTGQSLYYLGETDLKHKILAIVEEEGAEKASYALKLLQSEGELSIASTGKDQATGKLVTREYRVEGPVMIFITTTSIDIDEELQNRCIVLTVNESRQQTRAIHQLQRHRRTLAGLKLKKERSAVLKLHRNAQRLLKSLAVINPYAPRLTFLDDRTRTRRDHEKYLNLIDTIALLHQYQRPVKSIPAGSLGADQPDDYLQIQLSDIENANLLAGTVLGRSLDELPPQTRQLLFIIENFVTSQCKELDIIPSDFRFSRRMIREHCNWSNTAIKIHFKRLEEYEYLVPHRGSRGQTFIYELLYNGQGKDGGSFLMGLLEISKLEAAKNNKCDGKWSGLEANRSGQNEKKSPPSQAQVIGLSGRSQGEKIAENTSKTDTIDHLKEKNSQNAYIGVPDKRLSRRSLPAIQELSIHSSLLAAKIKEFEQSQINQKQQASCIAVLTYNAQLTPQKPDKGNGRDK